MRSFVARYSSRCTLCDERIEEGEQAAYVEEDSNEVAHLECALDEGYGGEDDDYDR